VENTAESDIPAEDTADSDILAEDTAGSGIDSGIVEDIDLDILLDTVDSGKLRNKAD